MPGYPYNAAVAEYFWRNMDVMGSQITGAAGSVAQNGVSIAVGADENSGRLVAVGFRAYGCPHIIAACSLLAERLEGQPVKTLVDPDLFSILDKLEIPIEKTGKILILQDALQGAYADYQAR